MTIKILLIEDDESLCTLFEHILTEEGFAVEVCQDGDLAMDTIEAVEPDLVLLDWMLPNMSGLALCKQIRSYKKTKTLPVILLTAKSAKEDKVRALEAGADDYITKPPHTEELVARIRALLRRSNAQDADGTHLMFNDIRLDPKGRRVYRNDINIHLGPTEFKLLECLMERPGRVLSRERLLDMVWGHETDVELRTVDVHIGRLRKALCIDDHPNPIRTVRAAGYALDENS